MRRRIALLAAGFILCGFRFGTVSVGRKAAQKQKQTLEAVVPRGNRVLAVAVTPAQNETFTDALDHASAATGFQNVPLTLFWENMETSPGVFLSSTSPVNYLLGGNSFYPPRGLGVVLAIPVLDSALPHLHVPADLSGTAYDDPAFVARFNALLDWAFTQIPNLRVEGLSIGNEVDVAFNASTASLAAYKSFYDQVSAHARSLRPGLKIGVKLTYDALTGAQSAAYQNLNQGSDVIMANYYAIGPGFTFEDPSLVPGDVDRLMALYPGRTVYFTEVGYPSGALCGSSESRQAAFLHSFFQVWDAHADHLKLASFTFMTDLSPAVLAVLNFGISDPVFLDYLATLGLRTYPGDGADKQAFHALSSEARARGW